MEFTEDYPSKVSRAEPHSSFVGAWDEDVPRFDPKILQSMEAFLNALHDDLFRVLYHLERVLLP